MKTDAEHHVRQRKGSGAVLRGMVGAAFATVLCSSLFGACWGTGAGTGARDAAGPASAPSLVDPVETTPRQDPPKPAPPTDESEQDAPSDAEAIELPPLAPLPACNGAPKKRLERCGVKLEEIAYSEKLRTEFDAEELPQMPGCSFAEVVSCLRKVRPLTKLKIWSFRDDLLPYLAWMTSAENLSLVASYQHPLRDITHIQALTKIRGLGIGGIRGADLAPLSKLRELEDLGIGRAEGIDLAPLARLKKLETLRIDGTLSSPSLEPLRHLRNLHRLELNDPNIHDITPLEDLRLSQLHLQGAPRLEDISALGRLSAPQGILWNLSFVSLSGTGVRKLDPLIRHTILDLDISNTPVEDLTLLGEKCRLNELNISGTPVKDLSPLMACAELSKLNISRTPVSDFSPLSKLSSLVFLYAHGTSIRDLNVLRSLTKLEELGLSDTKVRDLAPLAALSMLGHVDVSDTDVTDITPLLQLDMLDTVYHSGSKVRNAELLRKKFPDLLE